MHKCRGCRTHRSDLSIHGDKRFWAQASFGMRYMDVSHKRRSSCLDWRFFSSQQRRRRKINKPSAGGHQGDFIANVYGIFHYHGMKLALGWFNIDWNRQWWWSILQQTFRISWARISSQLNMLNRLITGFQTSQMILYCTKKEQSAL